MTYTQARKIISNPDRYEFKDLHTAYMKAGRLFDIALRSMTVLELIWRFIKLAVKYLMWYVGTVLTVISFLSLASSATAESGLPIKTVLALELLLIIGMVSAYIGYQLTEKEREKHGKRKNRS